MRITTRDASHPVFPWLVRLVMGVMVTGLVACSSPGLKPWHTAELNEEFTAAMLEDGRVPDLDAYLALEQRLFRQLEEQIYAQSATGPAYMLQRYSTGSAADPEHRPQNWNRTFELAHADAGGAVLLLHGMSDSPYSMRSLSEELNRQGYHVIALRLPGHGTIPSGLRSVRWQDMAAAVSLAMRQLAAVSGDRPLHIIGYSTGASLALNHVLDSLEQPGTRVPSSLVLISPAIQVHPSSAMAGFKDALSVLPGLDGLAYLTVMQEFDPYKYNSFATNAAAQVRALTQHVDARMRALAGDAAMAARMPPILAVKSTVDATVTTDAVVNNLLIRLPPHRNELLLFDINRHAAIKATLLVDDPGPLTNRLLEDDTLPFAVTLVVNENSDTRRVVARRKTAYSRIGYETTALGLEWPIGVVSLSHVALPFPPTDPLYGAEPNADSSMVFLGDLAIKGERGLLNIPGSWLLRQRYNPFHTYMQARISAWLETAAQP